MSMTPFQLRYCPARYLHQAHCPEPLRQVAQALPHWRRDSSINGWLLSALDLYIGQMKQLLSNSIEGLDYDRISVVLVPSAQARQLWPGERHVTLLSIHVMEGSRLRLLALVGALLGMLVLSNLAQYLWWRQRA